MKPTKKEYEKLIDDIIKYSDHYYKKNESLIPDKEFDTLMKRAEAIEAEHPDWTRKDSPTQKVGSDLDGANTLKHTRPMLSLENTYNKDEVKAWFEKMARHGAREFVVEPKYDGNSFAARYARGKLVQGLTRGDGSVGEDITQNLKLVESLNKVSKDFTGEIRGEIIMTNSEFERLNTDGQYANPRNLASGTLKLKDSEEFKKRKLTAYVYWLEDEAVPTHKESLDLIKNYGFDSGWSFVCRNFDEISKAIDDIWAMKKSGKIDIELDGAVLKVNDRKLWKEIGGTSKFPHWAKAYKYDPETATTKIKNVEFWVGHSGKITPVAILEPVLLSGSTVQKATLNNKGYLESLDVQIGDKVNIKKAAEIIPYINYVVKEDRKGSARTPVTFPTKCPSCGAKLGKHKDEHADFFCLNESCPGRVVGTIVKYASTMEIDGFGEVIVGKLHEAKLLSSIEDLYTLKDKRDQLLKVERMGEALADKLIGNVEASKSQPLEKFLAAISIRNAGKGTAKRLVRHFGSVDEIASATKEKLMSVEDIGDVVAQNIKDYFSENKEFIDKMKGHGVNMKKNKENSKPSSNLLAGKSICITGSLSKVRSEIEATIESLGGKNVSGVTKNTDYLVTNDQTTVTSKLAKARELGVKIISEAELIEMLEGKKK